MDIVIGKLILTGVLVAGVLFVLRRLHIRMQINKYGKKYTARRIGYLRSKPGVPSPGVFLYELEEGGETLRAVAFDRWTIGPPPYREDRQKGWLSPYMMNLFCEVHYHETYPDRVNEEGRKFIGKHVWILVSLTAVLLLVVFIPVR